MEQFRNQALLWRIYLQYNIAGNTAPGQYILYVTFRSVGVTTRSNVKKQLYIMTVFTIVNAVHIQLDQLWNLEGCFGKNELCND